MKTKTLSNGATAVYDRHTGADAVVLVAAGAGPLWETKRNAGVAHFLEHMLFEGTVKRPDTLAVTSAIEKLGGEMNAATGSEMTYYFAKVVRSDVPVALDVLSDMLFHSTLLPEHVEKERRVILNEIAMVKDDPKYHIWDMTHTRVFKGHPAANSPLGSKKTVSGMSREDLAAFHAAMYHPSNLCVVVVGDVRDPFGKMERHFGGPGGRRTSLPRIPPLGPHVSGRVGEARRIRQSYYTYSYRTVPRGHPDSYALDVAEALLGRKQSGWIFDEIRGKRGLGYSCGVEHDAEGHAGSFSVYVNVDKEKWPLARRLVRRQLDRLLTVDEKDMREAKRYLKGEWTLTNASPLKRAVTLAYFHYCGGVGGADEYLKRVREVTASDVRRVARKYLSGRPVVAAIEQK